MNETTFGNIKKSGNVTYQVYAADILCPHCGYYSATRGVWLGQGYLAFVCYRCKESIMIQVSELNPTSSIDAKSIIDYYPKRKVTVDLLVPPEMAKDYLEAQRCFSVAAWQACSVMARRCMHLVAEHFKAQGKDLYKQIEDLRDKNLITPVLADAAQRVRVLGKHGAHPYDGKGNAFNELELEDARLALEFCEFIFDQLFIQPAKIAASQKKVQ